MKDHVDWLQANAVSVYKGEIGYIQQFVCLKTDLQEKVILNFVGWPSGQRGANSYRRRLVVVDILSA